MRYGALDAGVPVRPPMLCLSLLVACSPALKHEGFKASISRATDPGLVARFEGTAGGSCALFTADRHEIRLRGEGFGLTIVAEPPGSDHSAVLVVSEQRFLSERAGARLQVVADEIGGRVFGSLSGTLVHESAGTLVDGVPAVVRDLDLDLTFNLQPCL